MTILTQASRQWATRPDDERFTSLHDLAAACRASERRSRSVIVGSRRIEAAPSNDNPRDGLVINGASGHVYTPTHWAFGQIAALAGAPASYLRSLPAPLAADCINYGLRIDRPVSDVGLLLENDGSGRSIRAATGPKYGRVWNADIAESLVDRFGDGVTGTWKVPGVFGEAVDVTKANTTLFASDRDMFVFLADEENRVEIQNRRNGQGGSLARGFFIWNSEVGATSIGAGFFLFDYVCCNRIVWGAEQYREFRLRHTASAPDRWLEEIAPVLTEYAEASAKPVEDAIAAAQEKKIDKVDDFLARRWSKNLAGVFQARHEAEEGRPIETLWDVTTAVTAYARDIPNQDQRVKLEREAGEVLALAAA